MVAKDYGSPTGFLDKPKNSIWVATRDNTLAGYIRFEGSNAGASDMVQSETTVAITAAYTRPEYRGQGAAPQMLNAALEDYAQQGYECCSVDFESFNPEAAAFWMKYFAPVCLSVIRVPESQAQPEL
jgi:ribosomal protein S18 acetylase RimI-like enzyme